LAALIGAVPYLILAGEENLGPAAWLYGLPVYLILWSSTAHWSTGRRRISGGVLSGCLAGAAGLYDWPLALLAVVFWTIASASAMTRDGHSFDTVARQRLLPALGAQIATTVAGISLLSLDPLSGNLMDTALPKNRLVWALCGSGFALALCSLPAMRKGRISQPLWRLVAAWLAAGLALVLFGALDPLPVAVPAALVGLAALDDAWT
jgi:hypothetical protein